MSPMAVPGDRVTPMGRAMGTPLRAEAEPREARKGSYVAAQPPSMMRLWGVSTPRAGRNSSEMEEEVGVEGATDTWGMKSESRPGGADGVCGCVWVCVGRGDGGGKDIHLTMLLRNTCLGDILE
jgi:hypothetical protein